MKERIVFVNDEFINETKAKVSIFDRGFLFADAVYEVTAIIDGKILEWNGHIKRLKRSLNELDIKMPIETNELLDIHYKLIEKNNLIEGLIYLQISRGEDDRSFDYPDSNVKPTIVSGNGSVCRTNNCPLSCHCGVSIIFISCVFKSGGEPYGSVVRCFASTNLSALGPAKIPELSNTLTHTWFKFLTRP